MRQEFKKLGKFLRHSKQETNGNYRLPLFINKPKIPVFEKEKGELKKVDMLIFGDEIGIIDDKSDDEYFAITYKKNGKLMDNAFIENSSPDILTQNRMLELYFIDVGQGDSILIHTPFDKKLLIDGGPDNTMRKFLQSRYFGSKVDFDAVVMTHADNDHAAGLKDLLDDEKIHIKRFWHNGIAKYKNRGKDKIGKTRVDGKNRKLVELFDQIEGLVSSNQTLADEFDELIDKLEKYKKTRNSNLVIERLDDTIGEERLARTKINVTNSDNKFKLTVLGPVNKGDASKPEYHYIRSDKETINGNSISLLIEYGQCRILLCGDMNKYFEHKFMESHKENEYWAHIFKANHHGSQYFCSKFLENVSPSISIVSAGYHPIYGHPRAILLGSLGKCSSNETDKPILFITKISGTYAKYNSKTISYLKAKASSFMKEIKEIIKNNLKKFAKYFNSKEKERTEFFSTLLSNVYEKLNDGTIYIRTDGTTVVAGRIISVSQSEGTKWEIYPFTIKDKRLIKHEEEYDCNLG